MVYNPTKVDVAELRSIVEREARAAGWPVAEWLATTEDDPGQGMAAQAISSGATLVIVAGGDGTVRAVAEGLRETAIPLALVPSGTGNLLARNLGLTLDDAEHSIHTAFTGDNHAIDLGLIDIVRDDDSTSSHAFLVMAGLGLDSKMLANTDDRLKEKAGWLAYAKSLAATLRDKNELRFLYRMDGGPQRGVHAHTIMVGNCGALPAKIRLIPDADVDDGKFDIVLLRPEGFVGWVQIFFKVLWENGVLQRTKAGRALLTREVSALRYVKAEDLEVELERPEEIELDGDGFGVARSFHARVDTGGLTIKVPVAE